MSNRGSSHRPLVPIAFVPVPVPVAVPVLAIPHPNFFPHFATPQPSHPTPAGLHGFSRLQVDNGCNQHVQSLGKLFLSSVQEYISLSLVVHPFYFSIIVTWIIFYVIICFLLYSFVVSGYSFVFIVPTSSLILLCLFSHFSRRFSSSQSSELYSQWQSCGGSEP